MKTNIKTYDDLENEKLRLQGALAYQGTLIRQDIAEIREELKPVTAALGFLGKFASRDKSNLLIHAGVDILGDLVLKKILFARSGLITRFVAPFLLKNFSSNFLQRLTEKLNEFMHRYRRKAV